MATGELFQPAVSIEEAHTILTAPGSLFETEEKDIRGVRLKVWKNAPRTLAELFTVGRIHGGKEFIVYQDERVTFDAHARAVAVLAKRLREEGVGPGDRVAIAMRNLPEWSVAFWACALIGAIATPLNAWWSSRELAAAFEHSGAVKAIVDAQRLDRMDPAALPSLRRIFASRLGAAPNNDRVTPLEDVIGRPSEWAALPPFDLSAAAMEPDDDVALFYTSGTTGTPKGAIISHRNIISNLFNLIVSQARAHVRRGEPPPALSLDAPQRVGLLAIPLFHVTGCFSGLVPALFGGYKMVFVHKWDPEQALQLVATEGVNQVGGVPTLAWQLIEHPRADEFELGSIDTVIYGGAPSAPELVKRIKEKIPSVQLPIQGWGMTETAAAAISNVAEDYVMRPASCGVPSPTGQARIVGPDGEDVPAGEVGELWYMGPGVFRGYWKDEAATAAVLQDGWLRTGDLARMDAEGFVYIVDRAKDMLIRGGENIYCTEVENALYEHPAVMDAAVVGIPHPTLGEEPGAVVTLRPGAAVDAEALRAHVAERLAAFKVPVRIELRNEPLPRNPAGKILKRELRDAFKLSL